MTKEKKRKKMRFIAFKKAFFAFLSTEEKKTLSLMKV